MEPVLTPEEMRRADQATIAAGTPSFVLMDRAAYACATVALRALGGGYGRRAVVVAGKGSNGGDGIAAARHLARAGVRTTVLLVGDPEGDAAAHLDALRRLSPPGCARTEPWSPGAFEAVAQRADLVVDAVFGTGFAGAPRGEAAGAIERMVACARPVLSVDIPSGVSAADGAVEGPAVRATVTVAIQALKAGHVCPPGAFRCGRIEVADIGIGPLEASLFVPEPSDVAAVLPPRRPDAHKYEAGVAALLAGSPGMTGAAILAARAALRAGAGLVLMGVPRSALEAVEAGVVEAVKVPLPDAEGQLDAKSVDEMADRLQRARAVAVGPGIGRGPRAVSLVRRALDLPCPLVVDADGLTALAELLSGDPEALRRRAAPSVLTPHAGELARLTGSPPGPCRITVARETARRLGAVVHCKGRLAVTADPSGTAWVNPTGGPALATAGTGDVLTGVVTALLARGVPAAEAAWAGAYLHGLAGDVACERLGPAAVSAGDVAACLPEALARLRGRGGARGRLRTVLEVR